VNDGHTAGECWRSRARERATRAWRGPGPKAGEVRAGERAGTRPGQNGGGPKKVERGPV
jgi:hypothetical protein